MKYFLLEDKNLFMHCKYYICLWLGDAWSLSICNHGTCMYWPSHSAVHIMCIGFRHQEIQQCGAHVSLQQCKHMRSNDDDDDDDDDDDNDNNNNDSNNIDIITTTTRTMVIATTLTTRRRTTTNTTTYGSGHGTAAVSLPGFAINWYWAKPGNKTATVPWPDPTYTEINTCGC